MRLEFPPTLLTGECLTLAQVKLHCRIDVDDDDTWLTNNIKAARQWVEKYIDAAVIPQTFIAWYDSIEVANFDRVFILPVYNALSITSVYEYDDNETATLWASTNYYKTGNRLALKINCDFPSEDLRDYDALKVTFIAGFGTYASPTWTEAVPADIEQAILLVVAHWYENRGDETTANMTGDLIPRDIYNLLFPYRRFSL